MIPRRQFNSLADLTGIPSDIGAEAIDDAHDPWPLRHLAACQNDETWAIDANGSISYDTSKPYYGTRSLKIESTGAGNSFVTCSLPLVMDIRGNVGVAVKSDNWDAIDYVRLWIYETGTTKGYKYPVYNRSYTSSPLNRQNEFFFENNKWAVAWFRRADYTEATTGDNAPTAWGTTDENALYSVATVQVRLYPRSGYTPTLWVGGVMNQEFGRALIIPRSDDCHESVYDNFYPILKNEYGWTFTLAVVGGKPDIPTLEQPYCSDAELDEMYAYGACFANHGYNHGTASVPGGGWGTGITSAEVVEDIQLNTRFLEKNGWHRGKECLIYPGYTAATTTSDPTTYFKQLGFKIGVGGAYRPNVTPTSSSDRADPWIPPDIYSASGVSWAVANQAIFEAAMRDHAVLILRTHDVQATPSSYGTSITAFRAVADMLQPYVLGDKGTDLLAEVVRLNDWQRLVWGRKALRQYTRSRV